MSKKVLKVMMIGRHGGTFIIARSPSVVGREKDQKRECLTRSLGANAATSTGAVVCGEMTV